MMTETALDDMASRRRAWLTKACTGEQPVTTASRLLQALVDEKLDQLPLPGRGQTLRRWQALCDVASYDLSLAKLYEGHTDALAILNELGDDAITPHATWGTWAAESPKNRVVFNAVPEDVGVRLHGRKAWCSGAKTVSHGLLTAWKSDGSGPWLIRVAMKQPGVQVRDGAWQSVGMKDSAAFDVWFDGALAQCVGKAGDYLSRPGFWQGGAGIAVCWYGGSLTIARALRHAVNGQDFAKHPFRLAALGKVDLALQQTAALLRETARWIDDHPGRDASAMALRVRLSAEACAHTVLDEVGRALGASPYCLDRSFAKMAADLPVFVRQSHAERDFMALGERAANAAKNEGEAEPWQL